MTKVTQLPASVGARSGDLVPIVNETTGETEKQPVSNIGMPPGALSPYAGTVAPTGWLLCYGQEVLITAYPDLYDVLGATYGVATSGYFKLPDMRGRVVAGQDDMGGTSANRVSTATAGFDGDILGAVGGSDAHWHWQTVGADGTNIYAENAGAGSGRTRVISVNRFTIGASSGVAGSREDGTYDGSSMQPTIILNYIIRY
jgi:microcystin-dependent protein